MAISITSIQNQHILTPDLTRQLALKLEPDWFNPDYWRNKNAITGSSSGRNTTWFIRPSTQKTDPEWVLRHYYRGGLVARLLGDNYFFSGLTHTRVYRELALLERMNAMDLPVPKPVAGLVKRNGLYCQADLLMEKIANAQDLVGLLKQQSLTSGQWHELGRLIKRFHQNGVYHSDLNAHNIMLDQQGQFWLIDFDKCEQRPLDKTWPGQNLARLKRSFIKETNLHSIHFTQSDWTCFVEGYQSAC